MSERKQIHKLNKTNECYSCKHRRSIQGDAHSACAKPDPEMKGDAHGIRNGWFMYPLNFDPVWKEKDCVNFEDKAR